MVAIIGGNGAAHLTYFCQSLQDICLTNFAPIYLKSRTLAGHSIERAGYVQRFFRRLVDSSINRCPKAKIGLHSCGFVMRSNLCVSNVFLNQCYAISDAAERCVIRRSVSSSL